MVGGKRLQPRQERLGRAEVALFEVTSQQVDGAFCEFDPQVGLIRMFGDKRLQPRQERLGLGEVALFEVTSQQVESAFSE
ncbi:MAG: hypothetical protein EAZ99_17675 [Alphaproteobacteria bacterium]|nr:MAG: hypothetical protein EAZ99_17675 [Alphaproteobacteria bacterium]